MKRQSYILFLFIIFALTACNALTPEKPIAVPEASGQQEILISQQKTKAPVIPVQPQTASTPRQQIVEIGSGVYIENQVKALSDEREEGKITLNFQSAPLREFLQVILGDTLEKNFIVDPAVTGQVTLNTAKPINHSALFPLLDEVLAQNGAALIQDRDYYHIVPLAKAIKGQQAATLDETTGYQVKIISLTYIAANEMQKILDPLLKDGASLRVDQKRNLLILSGTQRQLNQLQETINIFDVDWLRGMSVGLYPLEHVDSITLQSELDQILQDTEGGDHLLNGLVRTVALERLNSILLVSSTPTALREAEIWIYRLDRPGENVGKQLYVYKVQNAKATELAEVLGHIFGTGEPQKTDQPELAPGTTPVEIGQIEGKLQNDSGSTVNPRIGNSEVHLPTKGDVEIIADDVRNAIVVLATPQDYQMVASTIQQLDTVPLQVLIEASIIEVTLTDDLNYGVEWFFKNTIDDKEGRGTLDVGDVGISALAPSFSYTIVDSLSNVRVALNALASESDINVLSSPSLMVLDNQTARINVGDEIPVPIRQSTSNIDPNAPTVNEIQFRKTGVTLTVTPRVNDGGLVTMEIKQEVSDAVQTTTSNLDAPTIQQREIESVVAINSGETIVLGGLIKDSKTQNESGIPGLYKIPILGKLFGQTSNEDRRTELLVLLTPRVITNRNEARDITEEFRQKLKGITPVEAFDDNAS